MNGHVSPLASIILVGKQLRHELFCGEPPLLEEALLAILTIDGVLGVQHARAADADGLLTGAHHVEAEAALVLGVEHYEVHDGYIQHVLVQLDDFMV